MQFPPALMQEIDFLRRENAQLAEEYERDIYQRVQAGEKIADMIWYSPRFQKAEEQIKMVIYADRYPLRVTNGPRCTLPNCTDRTNTITTRNQTRSWDEPVTIKNFCNSCRSHF